MTTREILIDDLQDVEDALVVLSGVSNKRHITPDGIITILARAIYHILVHCIHIIERGEKKQ